MFLLSAQRDPHHDASHHRTARQGPEPAGRRLLPEPQGRHEGLEHPPEGVPGRGPHGRGQVPLLRYGVPPEGGRNRSRGPLSRGRPGAAPMCVSLRCRAVSGARWLGAAAGLLPDAAGRRPAVPGEQLREMPALAAAQLDERRRGRLGRHQAQPRIQQVPLPAQGLLVEESGVFRLEECEPEGVATPQHLLGGHVDQQIGRVRDALQPCGRIVLPPHLRQVGVGACGDQRVVEFLLPGGHEGRVRGGAEGPALDHRKTFVVRVASQVEAHEFRAPRLPQRVHPVQRPREQDGGVEPVAAMVAHQVEAHPVRLLGRMQLGEARRQVAGRHEVADVAAVDHLHLEVRAVDAPVGDALVHQRIGGFGIPVGPQAWRDRLAGSGGRGAGLAVEQHGLRLAGIAGVAAGAQAGHEAIGRAQGGGRNAKRHGIPWRPDCADARRSAFWHRGAALRSAAERPSE